jgi:hypothetical protein
MGGSQAAHGEAFVQTGLRSTNEKGGPKAAQFTSMPVARGRSLMLAAFAAFAGPPDLLTR